MTKSYIAEAIGFNEFTIGREIKRNYTKRGKYNYEFAQRLTSEKNERFNCTRKFHINKERIIR